MEITKNVGDGKFAPEKRVQNMLHKGQPGQLYRKNME